MSRPPPILERSFLTGNKFGILWVGVREVSLVCWISTICILLLFISG